MFADSVLSFYCFVVDYTLNTNALDLLLFFLALSFMLRLLISVNIVRTISLKFSSLIYIVSLHLGIFFPGFCFVTYTTIFSLLLCLHFVNTRY